MNKISATIVADSVNKQGDRLTSLLITFPRILLSEINTHRMLSKNTSSSRAIPFKKMVEAVENDPFIPIAWQKEHTGMQGYEYFTDLENDIPSLERGWLSARDNAIETAKYLNKCFENEDGSIEGLTKQLCNRLLEPFMWTTMLITGSKESWQNFFELRCPSYKLIGLGKENVKSRKEWLEKMQFSSALHPSMYPKTDVEWLQINKGQAEIHMMALAECIYDAMNESTPRKLTPGQWHIPFYEQITDLLMNELADDDVVFIPDEKVAKISVAMAAHTSYTVVGGEVVKSSKKWLELHDRLLSYDPPHSSPMEHCARAMSDEEYESFYKGQIGLGGESGWCNNLKGFIPYRYMIDNNLI